MAYVSWRAQCWRRMHQALATGIMNWSQGSLWLESTKQSDRFPTDPWMWQAVPCLASGFFRTAMAGMQHAPNTCTVLHCRYGTRQHQKPFGLVGYLLQEKMESLLLNRQSKTECLMMERKEEIGIQDSVPGMSLQHDCCHFFNNNIQIYFLALLFVVKIQKNTFSLTFKQHLGQAEVKKEEKVEQMSR